jgi:GNAT superfamily N-acetyltransferase
VRFRRKPRAAEAAAVGPGVRLAGSEDLTQLGQLIRAYLREQAAEGGPVRFTQTSLDWYRNLARSYLLGSLFGAVTIAEGGAGFAMGGEDPGTPRLDTDHGRTAVVWIAYVEPAYRKTGLAIALLACGLPKIVEMGFKTAMMGVLEGNQAGHGLCRAFGAELTERSYRFTLGGG